MLVSMLDCTHGHVSLRRESLRGPQYRSRFVSVMMTMAFVCGSLRALSAGRLQAAVEERRRPAETEVTPSASRHPARDVNRNLLDAKKGR
jgi:hypothetical protein